MDHERYEGRKFLRVATSRWCRPYQVTQIDTVSTVPVCSCAGSEEERERSTERARGARAAQGPRGGGADDVDARTTTSYTQESRPAQA